MINQVDFEGYLTRAWEYREQRFMRLANHRPGDNGRTASDYVTVQVDPALDFNPARVKVGQLLRITGRIVGRDIVEPLKLVVSKSHNDVELPGELNNLVVRRPTVQILATQIKVNWNARKTSPKTKQKLAEKAETRLVPFPAVEIQPGMDLAEVIATN